MDTSNVPTPLRWLWISLGLLSVGVGVLGAILPVLPSTEFYLLAAFFFARSSPRLYNWVLRLPKIGPTIHDFRTGLGMPLQAKRIAATSCAGAVIVSAMVIPDWYGRAAVLALGAIGVWYILFRVRTKAPATLLP